MLGHQRAKTNSYFSYHQSLSDLGHFVSFSLFQKVKEILKRPKWSLLWNVHQQFHLNQNMRLLPGQDDSSNYLLQLGSNGLPVMEEEPVQGCIEIPHDLREHGDLIDTIFPVGLPEQEMDSQVLLTRRSDTSLNINQQILQQQVEDVITYVNADLVEVPDNPDEGNENPQELCIL